MRNALVPVACVCVVALFAAGCAAPQPAREVERAQTTAAPADLAARPLYEFSEDDLDRYLRSIRSEQPEIEARIVHLARKALGEPYEIYLLGEFPFELHDPDPIYNLRRSDCLTFSEHIYAMALSRDWWSFLRALQRIRYKDGVVSMVTRNHYTEADWNVNNAFLFEDMTARLGGGQVHVPLTQVVQRAKFFKQFGVGQDVPDQQWRDTYIPKQRLPEILPELRNGDFVNIVRGDPQSQWVGHTGFIAIAADGTVDFLHSARPAVREQPLVEYVEKDKRCLGIKILRLRPDAQEQMDRALANPGQATGISQASLRAALGASPQMKTGVPRGHADDWKHAMSLQAYRLDFETPLDPALQAALEQADQRIGDELGLAAEQRAIGVLDLSDLRLALVRPDAQFYGASVPKIGIVLAYFAKHPGAATEIDALTERELQQVIKRSDNELAAKYSQQLGLDFIQQTLQAPRYRFYDPQHGGGLWCGKHYGIDLPRTGDPLDDHSHAATVRQCLRYYLLLEQGNLVSAAASARMQQIFAAPSMDFSNDNFVLGLNGRDLTMLRKSGEWEDWHLDTARVQHGRRVYLLAGMTHHPRGREYLSRMAAAIDDQLCGEHAADRRPFGHELLLQDQPSDFANSHPSQGHGDVPLADPRGRVVNDIAGASEGIYQTAPFGTRPFNEAVISWNVRCPADAGFCVQVRVGRQYDDFWSPWLHVGGRGQIPDVDRRSEFDGGRIDIDYFRSQQRYDRIQCRVSGLAPRGPVVLERLAICCGDSTGIPVALPAQRPPALPAATASAQRRLAVPFRSQKAEPRDIAGRICSPTSLAMVLEYRGVRRTTAEVAAACFDAEHGIYGNWPQNVQAAFELGVPGYLMPVSDWREVERMIAADQPLIASIRVKNEGGLRGAPYKTTDGHLIVVCGFDADGNVEVNDPAAATAERGQTTYRREDLEECWFRGSGGLAYILLPPDRPVAPAE